MSLGSLFFCTLLLGGFAYYIPQTFLMMVITIIFIWGCLVLAYISTAHKFILTNSHFIIKRYLKDSAIPLQNIKSIRPVTMKQFYRNHLWVSPFGHYPSKLKSIISYSCRWNNWVLLTTDRGKFLISPNDMHLIDATIQQIEKVKDGEANNEIMSISSSQWRRFIPIAITASVFFLVYMGYKEPRVVFHSDAFKLKGLYGLNIPFAEIAEADTITWREMPAISIRTNGISLMKVRRGNFRTTGGDKVRLSINRSSSPVIRIVDRESVVYYINRKNAAETRQIFNSVKP